MNCLNEALESVWNSGDEVALNDLPAHSPWVSRLLDISPWSRDERTAEDIEREYNREKYGPALDLLLRDGGINTPEELFARANSELTHLVCARGSQFRRLTPAASQAIKTELLTNLIKNFLPAEAIIDLGAGLGDLILRLAADPDCAGTRLFALEKMSHARLIISELARRQGLAPQVGYCDVFDGCLSGDLELPSGAVIVTSGVICLGTRATIETVSALEALGPKMVIHFEPFPSFFNLDTLYGQLCWSYALKNRHNITFDRDLFNLDGHELKIIETVPFVFGNNPFFPLSMIAWVPLESGH